MPVLLVSHSELYRTEEDYLLFGASHDTTNIKVIEKVYRVAELSIQFINHQEGKLTMVLTGSGPRYEEVYQAVVHTISQSLGWSPTIISGLSWMLGDGCYRRKVKPIRYSAQEAIGFHGQNAT